MNLLLLCFVLLYKKCDYGLNRSAPFSPFQNKKDQVTHNYLVISLPFYRPYGWIAPLTWHWHYPPSTPLNWKKYSKETDYKYMGTRIIVAEKKYKSAAWLVSNCATGLLKSKYFSCLDQTFPVHLFYQLYMQETGNLNITGLVQ